jgi:hypothetical protein
MFTALEPGGNDRLEAGDGTCVSSGSSIIGESLCTCLLPNTETKELATPEELRGLQARHLPFKTVSFVSGTSTEPIKRPCLTSCVCKPQVAHRPCFSLSIPSSYSFAGALNVAFVGA